MNLPKNSSGLPPRSNGMIRVPQVRLIDADGNQVGVLQTWEALKMAKDQGLDLVEINPKSSPPVCKIMDFGKFKYEQKKKEKEIVKQQKATSLGFKEVVFHVTTVEHDLKIKAENYIQRWLSEGNKVKICVMFRGREQSHPQLGEDVIKNALQFLANGSYTVEEKITLSGKQMSMIICPVVTETTNNNVGK